MYRDGEVLRYSPTDLTIFLDTEFGSWMDRWHAETSARRAKAHEVVASAAHAAGPFSEFPSCSCKPDDDDEQLSLIARMGDEHEKRFLEQLKLDGTHVVEVERCDDAAAHTLAHMRAGVPVIYQGCLELDHCKGYSDFLAKRDGHSQLGDHHYEVWDTKLARTAKPYFLIQLCAYAEMLEHVQQLRPAEVEIVLGSGLRRRFKTNNFFYYFRELKKAFRTFHKNFDQANTPDPGASKGFGRWSTYASEILAACDHPSIVARITRLQIKKLKDAGIQTAAALASDTAEPPQSVPGLSADVLARLRMQAKLQLRSRDAESPAYQALRPSTDDPRRGLALIPAPCDGDVFFDMEGYPLMEGGLEYLFGAVVHSEAGGGVEFHDWWAHDQIQEKAAFEGFVDWAFERWSRYPHMHIYHYAGYEVAALRRLMGQYATREESVDQLLRHQVFVDLYTVVRQGVCIGTPSYSLKDVEKLYRPSRSGRVTTAGGSVVAYQRWLDEHDGATCEDSRLLREIRDYNQVDCESLVQLRDWLLTTRDEAGITFVPVPVSDETEDATKDATPTKVERPSTTLATELLRQITAGEVADPERRRVQELLAWILEFHWREAKPIWWRMFDRREMTEAELVDDLDCLGGVERTAKPKLQVKRSWEYEYSYDPDQDTKLHQGSKCLFAHDLDVTCTITHLDPQTGDVTINVGTSTAVPPTRLSLIPSEYVKPEPIPSAIYRYVTAWSQRAVTSRCVDDLLHRRPPRIAGHSGDVLLSSTSSSKLADIVDLASRLDHSTLCIQGPPGTGKTYTAAAIIVRLLMLGKRVGITATSHKCVLNAMHAVSAAADKQGLHVSLLKVGKDADDPLVASGRIRNIESKAVAANLTAGPAVVGGTAWVFSRDDLVGQFDYLIVDEAGQFCLANVVATGQAAKNLILVGDQMQLAQPIQGSHPGESGKSGLDYVLQGKATVPPELGVFLDSSFRMHPSICGFISNAVYDGRLTAHPDTRRQEVRCRPHGSGQLSRTAGIVFIEVPHQFNAQCSDEEVEAIVKIVDDLVGGCVVGRDGTASPLTLRDILIVAPYNMQVRRLQSRLGPDARVGSVDRFQGQEAAVVIVSMCASSIDDCPRGIEFVLNKNRINVAVSRAKCLAVVVGCRGLMAARCQTIEQMEMANLYCWLAAHADGTA